MLPPENTRSVNVMTQTPEESAAYAAAAVQLDATIDGRAHDDTDLLVAAKVLGRLLPQRVLEALQRFRLCGDDSGYLLLRGMPTDPEVPATPGRQAPEIVLPVAAANLLLTASVVGDPVAYADERDGVLIQDICPVEGAEEAQGGDGSVLFEFHTENGFHPLRPEYLALIGLRADPDGVARTIVGSLRRALPMLDEKDLVLLRQPLYRCRLAASFGHRAHERYSLPYPVLTGSTESPDLSIDFAAMKADSEEASRALRNMMEALVSVQDLIAVQPGSLLLIDNRSAVHGRTDFVPRYDGHDRWLRRVFICADVRRTQSARAGPSHVIAPLPVVEDQVRAATLALAAAISSPVAP